MLSALGHGHSSHITQGGAITHCTVDLFHLIVVTLLFFSPVPSSSPTSFQVTDRHSSSITVQWGAVACTDRNGDITGYSVRYGVQGSGSTTNTTDVSGGATTEATISGLTPSTSYEIDIAAVNSAGAGVYSEPLTEETSVAGEPSHLQAVLLWLLVTYMYSIRCLCQVPGSGSLQPQLCEPHCSGGCYGWQ